MSTDTPTPERVTLTDEEQEDLREAIDADETWRDDCDECDNAISDDHHLFATVGAIIAAREQALREEIRSLVTASKATVHGRLALADTLTDWLAR